MRSRVYVPSSYTVAASIYGRIMNGLLNLHPKVVGQGLSGLAAGLVLHLLSRWVTLTPGDTATVVLIIGALGGYLAPILKQEEARLGIEPEVEYLKELAAEISASAADPVPNVLGAPVQGLAAPAEIPAPALTIEPAPPLA